MSTPPFGSRGLLGGFDEDFNDSEQQQLDLALFADPLHPRNWDCDGCPPPEFYLPPPPRPPWMVEANSGVEGQIGSDLDGCDTRNGDGGEGYLYPNHQSLKQMLESLDTCDSTMILSDSRSFFEDTFHSIAVIVVCSVVLVILLLVVGVVVFK